MKFSKFREFRLQLATLENVIKYLAVDLVFSLRELYTGLSRLNFVENFESFKVTVTVPASSELAIRNQLPETPTGKIILRDGGSNSVVDGSTAWNSNFVYLQNLSGSPVTVTAVFFK
jgi:hypothetical protein